MHDDETEIEFLPRPETFYLSKYGDHTEGYATDGGLGALEERLDRNSKAK
jgi:hypothetical protein